MIKVIKIIALFSWVISAGFIIYGSISGVISVPGDNFDKLIHGGAYALLAFLSFFFINKNKSLFLFLIFIIILGGLVEIIQTYVPGRDGTVGDFIADFIGVVIGGMIARKIRPIILEYFRK